MLNIGIVGAENSHTVAISKTLNIDKKVPGCRVTHVWGEAARYAKDAQDRGQIPNVVENPEDMIGHVDAACVDHRDAKYHLPAVWPLIEAGIPVFVDKPFCYRVSEGRRFLDRAAELGVPVCSFSVLPRQASFSQLKQDIAGLGRVVSVITTGPCDIESEWGGVFFYGIHQVDMAVRLLDNDVTHAQVNLGGTRTIPALCIRPAAPSPRSTSSPKDTAPSTCRSSAKRGGSTVRSGTTKTHTWAAQRPSATCSRQGLPTKRASRCSCRLPYWKRWRSPSPGKRKSRCRPSGSGTRAGPVAKHPNAICLRVQSPGHGMDSAADGFAQHPQVVLAEDLSYIDLRITPRQQSLGNSGK